jgi:signal transduction histidine kinase
MGTIYQQVLDLITTNPGNLIYHIVLAFTIQGALQAALNLWRDDQFPQGRRMIIGLGLLLGIRLLLFLGAGLGLVGLIDSHTILPNLDRAVMAFSLTIILWLWIFPETFRIADAASSLLGLLILTIFMLIQVWWVSNNTTVTPNNSANFNAAFVSVGWEILALLILIIGTFLLLFRRPNGWGYGLGMLGTLAIGHVLHLFFPDLSSDLPGSVRLFEMASFPLLWAIPNRFNLPANRTVAVPPVPQPTVTPAQPTSGEQKRFNVEPKLFASILALTDNQTQENTHQKLVKLLGEAMLADISLLILPPDDNGKVYIQCGYDLIREIFLPNISLNSQDIPMLVSAMTRGRPLRLPASSTSPDITRIARALDLGRTGHILAAFVPSSEETESQFGIVLISPYADRRWTRDDQAFLNKIASSLAPILRQTDQLERAQKELVITQNNLQAFQTLLKDTQSENAGLRSELRNLSQKTIQEQEDGTQELLANLKESNQLINRLQAENKRLEKLTEDLTLKQNGHPSERDQLKEELKLALTEIAQLRNPLSETEDQPNPNASTGSFPEIISEEQLEVFTSVAQDLRQPMSSILGYTDLLLSESTGILGALQRKFLDRIRASIERMDILLDDLFQIVTLDTGSLKLRSDDVDLGTVIDEAIVDTRSQFQERGIVLRVDLPDEMPRLLADQDALQQILINLLKNAGTASPVNGEIFLRASIYQTDDSEDYVLMQVADQGGGIPKDDLPRVFSRLYRADNPLIQGIGETGVGLSIVKALVEAHNGRIWVDTEMGKGSTFSLLIPLSNKSSMPDQNPAQGKVSSWEKAS